MTSKNYWLRGLQLLLLGGALVLAYAGAQRLLGSDSTADYFLALANIVSGVILLAISGDFKILTAIVAWVSRTMIK